jgi:archaellum component FlaC
MALTKQDIGEIQAVMTEAIAPVMEAIEIRFDGVDNRLDGVDKRLEGVEGRLDGVEGRLDGVITTQNTHTQQLRRLEEKTDQTGRDLQSLSSRLAALENDIKEIYGMLESHDHPPGQSAKLSLDQQILNAYQNILDIAKTANIKLPRSS